MSRVSRNLSKFFGILFKKQPVEGGNDLLSQEFHAVHQNLTRSANHLNAVIQQRKLEWQNDLHNHARVNRGGR